MNQVISSLPKRLTGYVPTIDASCKPIKGSKIAKKIDAYTSSIVAQLPQKIHFLNTWLFPVTRLRRNVVIFYSGFLNSPWARQFLLVSNTSQILGAD